MEQFFAGFEGVFTGSDYGSRNVMSLFYGSNISGGEGSS